MLSVRAIVIAAIDVMRKRKAITRTYAKLPDEDRQIVDAVEKTGKKSLATTQNIYETYSSPSPDLITLNERLLRAEEAGLIHRTIVNQNDEPVQVWKSNITTPKQTDSEQGDKVAT